MVTTPIVEIATTRVAIGGRPGEFVGAITPEAKPPTERCDPLDIGPVTEPIDTGTLTSVTVSENLHISFEIDDCRAQISVDRSSVRT